MSDAPPRALVLEFERHGFATWPALETESLGGWQLRFADGHTGRSNSVQPLDFVGSGDVEAQIDECEGRYRARGLPPRFKLTELACPSDLDERLAARGYARVAATRVRSLEFATDGMPLEADSRVQITVSTSQQWLELSARLNSIPASERSARDRMLGRIERPLYAFGGRRDRHQAVGLGALNDGWLFLGSIAVAKPARRAGLGRAVTATLMAHARGTGARGAWLQVTEDNVSALALYERIGFRDRYGYWYRVAQA